MPRQNRVTPFGELIAVRARGTLMGNRGCLHDKNGMIRRKLQGKRWISCLLSFKGRRQEIMAAGHYTQLFFLDEATALAAGHRPCVECQRDRFAAFRAAWTQSNASNGPARQPTAGEIDAVLHEERISRTGEQLTFPAQLAELPDGCFVRIDGDASAYLVLGRHLLRWRPEGYDRVQARPEALNAQVLTPRSTVRALAAGYTVSLHESAQCLREREG